MAARDELDALLASDDNVDLETLMNAARAHLLLGDGQGAEERVQRAQKLPQAAHGRPRSCSTCTRARSSSSTAPPRRRRCCARRVPNALRGETLALLMDAYLDLEQPDTRAEVVRMAPPRARVGVGAAGGAGAAGDRARPRLGRRGLRARGDRAAARAARAARRRRPRRYAILGRSQYEQGSFRLALRSLKAATELDARMARAWYTLGLVDFDLQRMADARTAMEAAVKADPLYADAWYYLGRTRAALADATAKDAYAKYLEVAPKGPYAAEVREALARGRARRRRAATPTSSRLRIRRRGR